MSSSSETTTATATATATSTATAPTGVPRQRTHGSGKRAAYMTSYSSDTGTTTAGEDGSVIDMRAIHNVRERLVHEPARNLWEPSNVDPFPIAAPQETSLDDNPGPVKKVLTSVYGIPYGSYGAMLGAVMAQIFPLGWLARVSRASLTGDIIAGFTIGIMLVPQGMAYALLAGLPPEYGLYTAIFPVIPYMIFGTTPILCLGPFALVSLLVAESAETLSGEEGGADASQRYIDAVILLSFFTGVALVVFSFLRMGFVTVFLSPVLVSGFTTSSAILIATSQLKHVFGLSPPSYDNLFKPFRVIYWILSHLDKANGAAIIIAVISIGILVAIQLVNKRIKGKFPIPIPGEFVVLVVGLLASWLIDLEDKFDVDVVGAIPAGLPSPSTPDLSSSMVGDAITPSIVLGVVLFAVSVSIGKTFEKEVGYTVRPNQELFALGLSNVVGSLFLCYPSCGSLSRSVVNAGAGGRTHLNSLFSALLVTVIVVVLTKPFEIAPQAVLASIIIVALKRLFLQFAEVPRLYRVKKADALVWGVVFCAVLILGVTDGLIAGVLFSLAIVVYKQMRPYTAVLGRFPGTRVYGSIAQYGDQVVEWPRIRVIVYGADLFYANVPHLHTTIFDLIDLEHIDYVVVDISTFSDIDISAARALAGTRTELLESNVRLLLAHPRKRIRSLFSMEHVFPLDDLFIDVHDACLFALEDMERRALASSSSLTSSSFTSRSTRLYSVTINSGSPYSSPFASSSATASESTPLVSSSARSSSSQTAP